VKKLLQSARAQAVLAWLAAQYVGLVAQRLNWRFEGDSNLLLLAQPSPVILVFWHEALPSMPVLWTRAKEMGMTRRAVVLASAHRDGQLIGQAVRHMGIGLVSGSSSRGGPAGLRGLLKALESGANVGLTPDGPRGPRRICAPGVAQLAAMSGCRILPCGAITSHARALRSWDQMRIPLPLGRGALVCGTPISVSRDDWQSALPLVTAALNGAMERAAQLL